MITLPNTTYKASDISLSAILNSTTKVNMRKPPIQRHAM